MDLSFHPNKTSIGLVEHGVNFVGYIIKTHTKYIRRSTIGNFYRQTRLPDRQRNTRLLMATANSYFGILRHANAFGERRRLSEYLFREFGAHTDPYMTKMIS